MSKHDEEYQIIIMIALIFGFMCIIIAVVGIVWCMCTSSILPCRRNEIKNIYTIQNVILQEDTL